MSYEELLVAIASLISLRYLLSPLAAYFLIGIKEAVICKLAQSLVLVHPFAIECMQCGAIFFALCTYSTGYSSDSGYVV